MRFSNYFTDLYVCPESILTCQVLVCETINFYFALSFPSKGSIIIGIDYDCRDKMVYWTDVAGRTINRVSLEAGAEPEMIIDMGKFSVIQDVKINTFLHYTSTKTMSASKKTAL